MEFKNLKQYRRSLALALCAVALVVSQASTAFAATFSDVAEGFWAYSFVEQAAEAGWVSGTGNGAFEPNKEVSNAEFATMVTNAFFQHTLAGAKEYMDEGSAWWTPYMETAYLKGILSGTAVLVPRDSGEFQWDDTVSKAMNRYDMAQVAFNVMSTQGKVPAADKMTAAESQIADWSSVPAEYRIAVSACYAAGVLNGTDSKGTFQGTGSMTRAQAAVVMCRLASL